MMVCMSWHPVFLTTEISPGVWDMQHPILAFEHHHPHPGPAKNALIRSELGLSEIRYYAMLGRAARSPQGIAADPITARIVREREEQAAARRAMRVTGQRV